MTLESDHECCVDKDLGRGERGLFVGFMMYEILHFSVTFCIWN
jgi:hypothetical protein